MSALRFEGSGAALAARGVRLSAGGGGGEVAGEQGEREGRTARGGPSRCWPWWSGGGSCGEGVGGLAWASGVGGGLFGGGWERVRRRPCLVFPALASRTRPPPSAPLPLSEG